MLHTLNLQRCFRTSPLVTRSLTHHRTVCVSANASTSRQADSVPSAASDATAAVVLPVRDAPAAAHAAVVDRPDTEQSDRKPKRKPITPQSTTILQSGTAVASGPLPEVLSATLPETFPTLSTARRVIRKDLVLVDGVVGSCKTEVTAGQTLEQLEPVAKGKGPRTVSLQVLFEDGDVAVVHKPWGVKMYGGDARRTITGALKAGALQPSSSPNALPEPKALHRLDAAVGGVLLIAKTASAAADISLQFKERRVHKVYHALLCGQLLPGAEVSTTAPTPCSYGQQQQQEQQQAAEVQQHSDHAVGSDVAHSQVPHQQVSSNFAEEVEDAAQSESDDKQSGEDDTDSASHDPDQALSLQELLQRQLQGTPAFTVSLEDLADPCLHPLDDSIQPTATTTSSSSSSSSSDDGSAAAAADTLGSGVHIIELPVDRKHSYSLYQVLGYSRSSRYGGWVTSVALSPVTGRKHQLRQHMAALGCPILGDGKYALNKDEHISNQGIYLESLEIAFTHPSTQQRVHVRLPEPQRFATMRQQLHNRWKKMSQAAEQEAAAQQMQETVANS